MLQASEFCLSNSLTSESQFLKSVLAETPLCFTELNYLSEKKLSSPENHFSSDENFSHSTIVVSPSSLGRAAITLGVQAGVVESSSIFES